jgi:ParB-like chromosome segregation protein Spo0J
LGDFTVKNEVCALSKWSARRISVAYQPIDHLKPDAANPRQHSRKQIQQIANSIEAFGFNVPILVDNDLKVIAGHGRLLAARKLGWDEVPTISIGHLTEAQARAFMIADNRLTELSSWDPKLLAVEVKALSVVDLDFSISHRL